MSEFGVRNNCDKNPIPVGKRNKREFSAIYWIQGVQERLICSGCGFMRNFSPSMHKW